MFTFFEKAMDQLKENGYFAFIVSSKFLRADYGKKLTKYLQQNFTILELIDFGDLQIFEGATTYPCIITIQKKKPDNSQQGPFPEIAISRLVADLGMGLKKDGQTIEIKKNDESWQLKSVEVKGVLKKLQHDTITLGKFVNDKIYYGIKTGFNEAFIIDTETKDRLCKDDNKTKEIIKPLLRGKDIKRYRYSWKNLWIIFTRRGININEYPAILTYLSQFKDNLEPGSGEENQGFLSNGMKFKIILPIIKNLKNQKLFGAIYQ